MVDGVESVLTAGEDGKLCVTSLKTDDVKSQSLYCGKASLLSLCAIEQSHGALIVLSQFKVYSVNS